MLEGVGKFKKVVFYCLAGIGAFALLAIAGNFVQNYWTSSASPSLPTYHPGVLNNTRSGVSYSTTENAAPSPMTDGSAALSTNSATAPAPATDRKIVKTGDLKLLVAKAEDASAQIKTIATSLGGYVDEANIYDVTDASKAGTVTIKVPADKFDETMGQLKKMAIKVESETAGTSDVTADWVDLQARLKSLQAEEDQYLAILKDAKNVEDVLKVTQSLSSVQSDIERLQANIRYTSSQVDLSSISISLDEDADVQVFGLRWTPLLVIKQAARNMLQGLTGFADFVIAFVFFLPALILWAILIVTFYWIARKIYRYIKTKFFV